MVNCSGKHKLLWSISIQSKFSCIYLQSCFIMILPYSSVAHFPYPWTLHKYTELYLVWLDMFPLHQNGPHAKLEFCGATLNCQYIWHFRFEVVNDGCNSPQNLYPLPPPPLPQATCFGYCFRHYLPDTFFSSAPEMVIFNNSGHATFHSICVWKLIDKESQVTNNIFLSPFVMFVLLYLE